jgi:hypothetical protein
MPKAVVKIKNAFNMKKIICFTLLILISLPFISCKKKNSCNITATITQSGTPCSSWGINVGIIYPSYNIPDQFKQEGLQVCVEYVLYEDPTMCPCCGGTRANIISMNLPED